MADNGIGPATDTGDWVIESGEADRSIPVPNVKIDLDAKITRYLHSLHTSSWPMRVFHLHHGEREAAEAWIKELIGRVLNA